MPAWSSIWFVATSVHVLLTFRRAWRMPGPATTDERIWIGSVATVGILATGVHTLATTVGLSIPGGVAFLAVVHLVAGRLARPLPAAGPTRLTWQEGAAVAAWSGLVLTWLAAAAGSAEVIGTDAASYHAPHAVNLARGASLFDLPATQHLYPQLAAAMGAWFVLPFDGPTVIEVSMLLPLLLLAASVNLIFRLSTGLSGLAWTSWLVLILLAVPLVRFSTHFSADLWFTAGYMAVLTCLLRLWCRRRWTASDLLAGAVAAGLLLGSKTTGTAALGLMLVAWAALEGVRWVRTSHRPQLPGHAVPWAAAMMGVAAGSGGIWLVRNWVLFGSPLAPSGLAIGPVTIFPGESLQNSQLLSVLFDLQAGDYALAERTAFHVRRWIGWWYLPAAALTFLVPVDAFIARLRGRTDESATRLALFVLTVVPGAVLVWLLIGAPWTSLEWTQGFSLRYALPVIVLLLVVAAVALFPVSVRWYGAPDVVMVASIAAILGSTWLYADSLTGVGPRFTPWPAVEPAWLAAGAALVLVLPRLRPLFRTLACGALLVAIGTAWIPTVARATEANQEAIKATIQQLKLSPEPLSPYATPLAAAVTYEAAAGSRCSERRFFVLARFDMPLQLQDPRYRSVVFYAGRDPALLPRYAPIGSCDYIVTTPALLGTDRGWMSLATLTGGRPLRRLTGAGPFVTLAAGRLP